jgi:2-aminoadipate transaminase
MEDQEYTDYLSAAARVMRPNAIRALSKYVSRPDVISFAGGVPSAETFPKEQIAEIAARLIREQGSSVLQYGLTRGNEQLREYIRESLATNLGAISDDEVLITTGSQQGLDLVCRVLIDPGDVVFIELPSYIGGLASINNAQAEMVGVRQDPDGIDLEHLQSQIDQVRNQGKRPKLIYTIPNFQNPSGVTMSIEKRRQLLEVADRNKLLIIEDDPYGDLHFYPDYATEFERPPELMPIRKHDQQGAQTGRVVYLGSFSKVLAPGLRSAFVISPSAIAKKIELAKEAADLCGSMLDQAIVNVACREGLIKDRMPVIRQFYKVRCQAMLDTLGENAPAGTQWTRPTGGLFVWMELSDQTDTTELLKQMVELGVAFVPGQPFFVNGEGSNTLRLAFSKESPETITEGIRKLCHAL